MPEIKKVMNKTDSSIEQFYPETHADAVKGLREFIKKIIEEETRNGQSSSVIRKKK